MTKEYAKKLIKEYQKQISDKDYVKMFSDMAEKYGRGTWIDFLDNVLIPANMNILEKAQVIPTGMFDGSGGLQTITIPENVEAIEHNAFSNCSNLMDVKFAPNGKLKTIGEEGFEGCKALKAVYFPNNIEKIGKHAFLNCDNLEAIVFPTTLNSKVGICFHAFGTQNRTRVPQEDVDDWTDKTIEAYKAKGDEATAEKIESWRKNERYYIQPKIYVGEKINGETAWKANQTGGGLVFSKLPGETQNCAYMGPHPYWIEIVHDSYSG